MKAVRELLGRARREKRVFLPLLAGLAGLLLLFASGAREKTGAGAEPDALAAQRQAEAAIETRLEKLLSTVAGVGKAEVMVTLDRLERTVYAADAEAREGGGSEKTVTVKNGSGETGLPLYTELPQVRGVAVSCRGGGSASVRREVTELICAALGVTANRVRVSAMAA